MGEHSSEPISEKTHISLTPGALLTVAALLGAGVLAWGRLTYQVSSLADKQDGGVVQTNATAVELAARVEKTASDLAVTRADLADRVQKAADDLAARQAATATALDARQQKLSDEVDNMRPLLERIDERTKQTQLDVNELKAIIDSPRRPDSP